MATMRAFSTLSSSDLTDWPPTEVVLARFDLGLSSTAPPWGPPPVATSTAETPSIGHNNPPWPVAAPVDLPKIEETRFAQQIEAIIDSADYDAIKKLILLKMRLRVDHDTLANAFPSYATLMRAASVKDDRAVRNAIDELVKDGIVTREERPGRSFGYGLSKERLQEVIGDFIIYNRERRGPGRPPKPPSSNVGGFSGIPSSSNVGGFRKNPPHLVQGVSENPPHLVQKPPPSDVPLPSLTYKDILTERNSDPVGSGADAPSEKSTSLKSIVWKEGLAYLKRAYDGSVPEEKLRSRLGALIKAHSDGLVLDALTKAEKAEVLDPLDYVTGILRKSPGKPRSGGQGVF